MEKTGKPDNHMNIVQQATARTRNAISALLAKATNVTVAVGKGIAVASLAQAFANMFAISRERTQIHRDMHRMDRDDEVVSFAFNTIANRAVGMEDPTLDAFEVTVQAAPQEDGREVSEATIKRAQWEINRLIKRLNLRSESWQIVRSFVKWGNEFREVVTDPDTADIIAFDQLPEHTMRPLVSDRGKRLPGFEQRPENLLGGSNAISFAEWEIIHFAFGEKDGYLGTPLLGCARKNWKRLNLAEDSTSIARLIRAFAKYVHRVPINSDWDVASQKNAINEYKTNMSKRPVFNQGDNAVENLDDPLTVLTDFYVPDDGSNRGGVEMLDPENAQLQNIKDLEHFLNRLITATTIPKRYFPFEGSTPKLSEGGGQAEDKHFACTLMFCHMVLKIGYGQLFDRQLILKGINPEEIRYVMRMADINTTDLLRAAQTQLTLQSAMKQLLTSYPELREHLSVMLREYTKMSDASMAKLSDIKVKPGPPEGGDNGTAPKVQLPGMGNKEARTKV